MNTDKLKVLINKKYPEIHFSVVRYTYIIENQEKEILIMYSNEEYYPYQIFCNKWELFSDTSFFNDTFISNDFDDFTLEIIEESLTLDVSNSKVSLIALNQFNYSIIDIESTFEENEQPKKRTDNYLNLYLLIPNVDANKFKSTRDLDYVTEWIKPERALEKLQIEKDKEVLGQYLNNLKKN
ncbi:hypothetical protein [Flavivirga jejuensis]|uniref:Uncharacterized protein n=1 Tax=Flavivirga jejuensis TaxID=870487 RepID=A0ABT8WNX2_9FLAO|nr:hypothetical protein [Flavivirga jejuensis]MDO5974622.1 hypothetical protein [Flavivirga jejuensis]